MAKGHRSQIKRERNENNREKRPSATLTFARIPEQKACFVMDAIRGKDVTTALAILQYNPRYASEVTYKLLKSAVANAENNNGMNPDNLYVAECFANNGPIMKRIQPRAQGRAYRILKRMCHLTVILDEKNKTEDTEDKNDTEAAAKTSDDARQLLQLRRHQKIRLQQLRRLQQKRQLPRSQMMLKRKLQQRRLQQLRKQFLQKQQPRQLLRSQHLQLRKLLIHQRNQSNGKEIKWDRKLIRMA